jgi:hypothetical protein
MSTLNAKNRFLASPCARRWWLATAAFCLNAFAVGCGAADSAATTGPLLTFPQWIGVVSNATRAIPDPAGSVAFVSLPTGAFEIGERATIRNMRTNAQATATMSNGGFDPVRIPASTGDLLRIQIDEPGGQAHLYTAVVPARQRPVVIRTEPARGSTAGVSPRSVVRVLFSEPIRLNFAVRLTRGGEPVPGDTRLFGVDQLQLIFTPNAPLDYATTYDFEIGKQLVDLDGESLETSFRLALSTGVQAPPPLFAASFSVVEYSDGASWTYAPQLVVTLDAAGGDVVVDRTDMALPGIGSFSVCWLDGRLVHGSTTVMFRESYGDWMYAIGSSTRATTPTVTASIKYSTADGEYGYATVRGSIVPGSPPTTYSGASGPQPRSC